MSIPESISDSDRAFRKWRPCSKIHFKAIARAMKSKRSRELNECELQRAVVVLQKEYSRQRGIELESKSMAATSRNNCATPTVITRLLNNSQHPPLPSFHFLRLTARTSANKLLHFDLPFVIDVQLTIKYISKYSKVVALHNTSCLRASFTWLLYNGRLH